MWRILFAADGSEDAAAAAQFLGALPFPPGTKIRVVSVAGEFPARVYSGLEALAGAQQVEREWAEHAAETARAALQREDVEVTAVVRIGQPAHQILEEANEFDASLVALGSRGLNRLEAFMLGSVSESVTRHAGQPVLLARAPKHGLRRAILAVDDSEPARSAVEFAGQLPLPPETQVVVAHVVKPYHAPAGFAPTNALVFDKLDTGLWQERLRHAECLVAGIHSRMAAAGKRANSCVREGDPAAELSKLASESEADLIIAGARGVSLVHAVLLGSVADRLLRRAHCSVLIVR